MKPNGGLIGFYNLADWWLGAFTPQERSYLDNSYQPPGSKNKRPLTRGRVEQSAQTDVEFLGELAKWFRHPQDASIADRIWEHQAVLAKSPRTASEEPGGPAEQDYRAVRDELLALKRTGNWPPMERLLLGLIEAGEREARARGTKVPAWCYTELARLYAQQNNLAAAQRVRAHFEAQHAVTRTKRAR